MGLRGYIDGVIGDELVGWALDEDAPDRRLRVQVELDGAVLGTAEACEYRRDLVAAGFGDGGHGFRLALDPGRLTPGVHPVAAVVGGEALPLAHDWIVRDHDNQPLELVRLEAGVPTGESDPETPVPPALAPAPVATPAREIDGHAGWKFLLPPPAAEPSHAQLDEDAEAVERLFELAGSVGATACVVRLPAKHLLYAEHLPAEHRTAPDRRPARRLAARLRDSDAASLLDLHDELQDARVHGRLYSRTGQRLTWTGAIHAYRAIAKVVAGAVAELRPHPLAVFDFGELEPVAGAADDDTEPLLAVRPPAATGRGPSGLVVHDGSGSRIAELLGLHLSGCRVVEAERVEPELVLSEKPDLVVWIGEDR